jgi:hypothetical protein
MIMLRRAFLARLLLVDGRLFDIRFDKRGRRRLLLFQFLDALCWLLGTSVQEIGPIVRMEQAFLRK